VLSRPVYSLYLDSVHALRPLRLRVDDDDDDDDDDDSIINSQAFQSVIGTYFRQSESAPNKQCGIYTYS